MLLANSRRLIVLGGTMLILAGCASLDVTTRKTLTPVTEKQGVTLGVLAGGDRLQDILSNPDSSHIKAASGQLFDKVTLLPKESKLLQYSEIKSAYGVDYILSLGIADISVNGNLNPLWFATLPLFVFKVYTPIVTFQPGVALEVTLRDAATGSVLLQKQVMESSSDYFAPIDPGPKVRKLISLAISNALVVIFQESQQSIAAARQRKK